MVASVPARGLASWSDGRESDGVNKHEVQGEARYVAGKVEATVGDALGRDDWQVSGVRDQVVGSAEKLVGRAQSLAADVADTVPAAAARTRARAAASAKEANLMARRTGGEAVQTLRSIDPRWRWAAIAALGGVAVAWFAGAGHDGRRR